VLQGGTQYNLAAVKAQVDYIKERVPDGEVYVHPHTGEAGAIGAAMETLRVVKRRGTSTFIGIAETIALDYSTKNDEETVCHFCPNECKRTFIDTKRPDGSTSRYISGFSCEKGTVESKEAMLELVADRKKTAQQFPNCVDYEQGLAFRSFFKGDALPPNGAPIKDVEVRRGIFGIKRKEIVRGFQASGNANREKLRKIRIGMPRVLNMYSTGPFFRAYFEALGVPKANVVFSDETTEERWVEGGKYGSIDPCFPSKVAQAHVHDLLFNHHTTEKPLQYIFFPILTHMPNFMVNIMDNAACPIVAGAPEVMKAAFTKEVDFFAQRGIEYLDPAITFAEPTLTRRRMFDIWGPRLGITEDESDHAVTQAWKALAEFDRLVEEKGRAILETVEAENRVAILVLARPYHSDPGLNHGIPEEFQVLGYPILSIRSIPKDEEYLKRYFKEETARGQSVFDINDVWPENYSTNSAQKVWAAKFAARHPNVVVLDLSSFKCGHDAPTYGMIDNIIEASQTPYAALHDLDANKPGGSIKIRVKTYAHSLSLYEERLSDQARQKDQLAYAIEVKRLDLLKRKAAQLEAMRQQDPALRQQIEELATRLAAYKAPERKPEPAPAPKGLVQLKKKAQDGALQSVSSSTSSAAE
jgi:predicted nucleotide-binding protein (sugar kinase/HSP70/actin superfamily)